MFKTLLNIFFSFFNSFKVAIFMMGNKPVTRQYPKEKESLRNTAKQIHVLAKNKDGSLKCISCKMCEKICPVDAIKIKTEKKQDGSLVLKDYIVDYSKCIFCGLCEEVCPVESIQICPTNLNNSHKNKKNLFSNKEKLVKNGEKYKVEIEKGIKENVK